MPQLRNHTIVRKQTGIATDLDDWRDQSACRDADPEIFFPHPTDTVGLQEALDHCAVCPVKAACLEFAIDTRQEHGVWGGLTETQVREKHGLARIGRATGCGTNAGWQTHRTRRTTVCQPCHDAHEQWLTKDRRRRLDQEHATAGGSAYGATLHQRLSEPACPPCAEADRQRQQRTTDRRRQWKNENRELVNKNQNERRRQAREAKQAAQPPVGPVKPADDVTGACGTNNGYHRHRRRGIPVCRPCRAAKNAHQAEYNRRKAAGEPVTDPRKVSEEQYAEIARRRDKGETLMSLAAAFGISKTQVRRIIAERTAA